MSQPRDSYRELLRLSLFFLDSWSTETFIFKCSGAIHNARLKSKAIYSLKIFMFRDQLHLSSLETKKLQVCIFRDFIVHQSLVWYLYEELAVISLYDNNVSVEIKMKMVAAIVQKKLIYRAIF